MQNLDCKRKRKCMHIAVSSYGMLNRDCKKKGNLCIALEHAAQNYYLEG